MVSSRRRGRVRKVISGGQTGADRAALDVALELGIPIGGWCPRGRLAEDGPLDAKYTLDETDRDDYAQRTEFNVRDSDATLILATGQLTGGTALTRHLAQQYERPCLVVDPSGADGQTTIEQWLASHDVAVLNVAGPRESTEPGIQDAAAKLLRRVLAGSRSDG